MRYGLVILGLLLFGLVFVTSLRLELFSLGPATDHVLAGYGTFGLLALAVATTGLLLFSRKHRP